MFTQEDTLLLHEPDRLFVGGDDEKLCDISIATEITRKIPKLKKGKSFSPADIFSECSKGN